MSSLYRALRGVCIGPERHVTPDSEPFALDKGTATFLTSIGAVEEVPATPAPADPAPSPSPAPEPPAEKLAPAPAPADPAHAPVKAGKKEK
ncbi:MAG TPA: hypothetical protein VEC57_14535 [Candidatus Limnocylindrales bacterium]|nr:hypothetical protein [Candidatus Limnocylindrales bacterium]